MAPGSGAAAMHNSLYMSPSFVIVTCPIGQVRMQSRQRALAAPSRTKGHPRKIVRIMLEYELQIRVLGERSQNDPVSGVTSTGTFPRTIPYLLYSSSRKLVGNVGIRFTERGQNKNEPGGTYQHRVVPLARYGDTKKQRPQRDARALHGNQL